MKQAVNIMFAITTPLSDSTWNWEKCTHNSILLMQNKDEYLMRELISKFEAGTALA